MATKESPFMKQLLVELCKIPEMRAWRINAGKLLIRGKTEEGAPPDIRAFTGAPSGSADIHGVAWPGIHFEVETKSSEGEQRESQEKWERMLTGFHGLYILMPHEEGVPIKVDARRKAAQIAGRVEAHRREILRMLKERYDG